MDFLRKLPIPMDIKQQYPLDEKMKIVKNARDFAIKQVFTGDSNKFILIIGPCSADEKSSGFRLHFEIKDCTGKS